MKSNAVVRDSIECKVKILCKLPGVFAEYQPTVGATYDAKYRVAKKDKYGHYISHICVITVRDKTIFLRPGEYEIMEEK